MSTSPYLTLGVVAEHFRELGFAIDTWHVRRAIERKFLSEPPRCGVYRVFHPEDLPRIENALRKAGYLREVVNAS
ncbi:MAG: hypothetical protein L0Z62_24530 [Gemmataceae bacterium]|nr:hypothetical protein [Gemmataceae bacterium]